MVRVPNNREEMNIDSEQENHFNCKYKNKQKQPGREDGEPQNTVK